MLHSLRILVFKLTGNISETDICNLPSELYVCRDAGSKAIATLVAKDTKKQFFKCDI